MAASDSASHSLEASQGPYTILRPLSLDPFWDHEDAQDMAESVLGQPNLWSDGSREPIPYLDVDVAGAGLFVAFQLVFLTTTDGDTRRFLMAILRVAPIFLQALVVRLKRFKEPSTGV